MPSASVRIAASVNDGCLRRLRRKPTSWISAVTNGRRPGLIARRRSAPEAPHGVSARPSGYAARDVLDPLVEMELHLVVDVAVQLVAAEDV
jgi:hypothetical protein